MLRVLADPGNMLEFSQNFRKDFHAKEHSSFSLAEIALDHKFEKFYTGVNPKDRHFGDDCGFDKYNDLLPKEKNQKINEKSKQFWK